MLNAYHLAMLLLVNGGALGLSPAIASEVEQRYSALRFGAVGDGKTLCTLAVQEAINTASAAGGGTVFFPAGRFLCGTLERITLSNITIEGVHAPLFMRLGNRARKHTPEAPAPPRHGRANGLTCRQN
jgi:hypothetical protein